MGYIIIAGVSDFKFSKIFSALMVLLGDRYREEEIGEGFRYSL